MARDRRVYGLFKSFSRFSLCKISFAGYGRSIKVVSIWLFSKLELTPLQLNLVYIYLAVELPIVVLSETFVVN